LDAAIEASRVNRDSAKTFVKNRLVVIFPIDNPGSLQEQKDLAKAGLKLVLGDESVPVGKYALEFLDKAVQDPGFDPMFKDNVLKNVVSYEDNVKSVLTKVVLEHLILFFKHNKIFIAHKTTFFAKRLLSMFRQHNRRIADERLDWQISGALSHR